MTNATRANGSENESDIPMRAVPVLAALATAAALVDFLGTRLWVRVVANREISGLTHGALVDLKRGGDFVRNIAGIAGLIALSVALTSFIQPRAHVRLTQRIGLAGFAGIFLPTIFLATVLSAERTTVLVVLFAAAAANLLVVLMSLASLRWKAPIAMRIGLGAAATMAFFAFSSTVVLLIGRITLWESGYPLGMGMRHVGEVAYAVALVAIAYSAWPHDRQGRWRIAAAAVGVLVGCGTLSLFVLARAPLEAEAFGQLLYGAMHADLFVASAPLFYGVLVSVTLGLAVTGLFSAVEPIRQTALGAILLAAAGFAPTTPSTLLTMVLGITLIARAIVARSALQWMTRADDLDDLKGEIEAELGEEA